MKKLFSMMAALLFYFATGEIVLAQSVPYPISLGTVWTPTQWNNAWQKKLDYPATTAVPLFSWTTAGRPGSPAPGWIGYNTSLNMVEYWNGTSWASSGGSGTINAGAQYSLPYFSASGSASTLSALSSLGTSGQILTSQGAGMPPHWTSGGSCTAGAAYCVGWFNAVSYGADPTGVADSTTAIASAISAACAATPGGNVYFPAGIYKYSSIVLNCNGVYLVGDNIQTTNLQVTAGSGDAILIGSTSSSIVTLDTGIMNMQISASGMRSSGYMVHVANIQGSTVENLFIYTPGHNYTYTGVGIDCFNISAGCYTHKLTNVQVAGAQHNGIGIGEVSTSGPPSDIFLTNINIGSAAATGLAIDWTSGLYGTSVEAGGGTYGVGFFPSSGKWVFDAWFDKSQGDANSAYGWYFSGAGYYNDIHLFNGWGSSNTINGLYVDTTAVNLTGLQVIGGSYTFNGQYGILVNAGKNITISDTHEGSNSQTTPGSYSGIAFGGTAAQFTVIGNDSGIVGFPCLSSGTCPGSASQQYGLNIVSGSNNDYIVEGNLFLNNATSGIADAGGATKFICNNLGSSVTANCGGGGGSGTVNSATSGQLAYYAASGNTVSGTSTPTVTTLTVTGLGSVGIGLPVNVGVYCTSGCSSGNQNAIYVDATGQTWIGSPGGSGGSNIVVQNSIKPSAANSFNIGASGDAFQQEWVNVATIGTSATINGNIVPSFTGGIASGGCIQASGSSGLIATLSTACGTITNVSAGSNLSGGGSSGSISLAVASTPSFTSVGANTYTDTGGSHSMINISGTNIFLGGGYGTIASEGDFLSNGDGTYNLGNVSFRWNTSHVLQYYAGSGNSAGVSCSGSPTSSFASVNGIVTHC